jgi:hypothetical protein
MKKILLILFLFLAGAFCSLSEGEFEYQTGLKEWSDITTSFRAYAGIDCRGDICVARVNLESYKPYLFMSYDKLAI